jgi:hypothetical protein
MTIGAERDHSLYIVGVDFVVLTLPMLPVHHTSSRHHCRVPHPFREPLQFIVMSVIGVISLYLKGCHMTVPK